MNLVAIDDKGNFYYRYPDGSMRYYEHSTATETVIAKSVKAFLLGIEPENKNKFREIDHAKN